MANEREDSAESHAIGVSWWMRVSSEIRKRSRLRKDFAPYNYPPQGFPVEDMSISARRKIGRLTGTLGEVESTPKRGHSEQ